MKPDFWNERFGSEFQESYRVQKQTPENGQIVQRRHWEFNGLD